MQIPSLPSEQESRGPDYQQPIIFDGNGSSEQRRELGGQSNFTMMLSGQSRQLMPWAFSLRGELEMIFSQI